MDLQITLGFALTFIVQIFAFVKNITNLISRVNYLEKELIEIKLQYDKIANILNETVKTLEVCQAVNKVNKFNKK